jgi:uncharacterized protein involved in response to NO
MILWSAGFRPFFLGAAAWAAIAVPVWLAAYVHGYSISGGLPAMLWHGHEMVYGFGLAAVAGFLLTAIPNWTGRLPVRGTRLAALAGLWLAGRIALLAAPLIGPLAAAVIDLAFPLALAAVVARELVAGGNLRNLPMPVALLLLAAGSGLVHLHALDVAYTAALGNRVGIGVLLALIALVGGRLVPSFTRNWLAKKRSDRLPHAPDRLDVACLAATVLGIGTWVAVGDGAFASMMLVISGTAAALRLARWRGLATTSEPLLFVLHAGYGWLAFGLLFLGLNGVFHWAPPGAPLHALTVGAIGTMTLAVMTRASLGHSGQALVAGPGTTAMYVLVGAAACLRIASAFPGSQAWLLLTLAGVAWSVAFGLFVVLYGPILASPRNDAHAKNSIPVKAASSR